jgi:tight adherence protein B
VRRLKSAPDAAATADTVLKLAVLLQAGVTPVRAWTHLADSGDGAARRIVDRVAAGAPLVEAISRGAAENAAGSVVAADGPWAAVSGAWRVASIVGAPLAESLRGMATALRDAHEAADDVRVALAEPAGTAKLMGWLPLVAVAMGAGLGFDTLGMLFGHPVGIACLVAGVTLIVVARRWTAALVRRAASGDSVPGHSAELLAIALSGGVSIERASALVADAGGAPDRSTDEVLALSRRAGVPAVELLRASAELARHRARTQGRLRAARLPTRLLLPLGVCTLPAFLLLGVAPTMLGVMSSLPSSW